MSISIEKIIIVGSGPAAYTASLFTSKYSPLLFEGTFINGIGPGGQLTTTVHVNNYPGFEKGVGGPELMAIMKKQAEDLNVRIISETVESITNKDDYLVVLTENKEYRSHSVIIGTGGSSRRIYVPGTNDGEYWQKGISTCAHCDGFLFKDLRIGVIGGGDSSMEAAIYLANIGKKVYLIHRRNEFRAREDKLDEVKSISNIEILTPYNIVSAHGSKSNLKNIVLSNTETNENRTLELEGLFFAIGHDPNTDFVKNLVEIENRFIKVNNSKRTNVPGIFACGDVEDTYYKQAIVAASSGCESGIESLEYLYNKGIILENPREIDLSEI